ncbi:hypothetical protein DFH28DRAFT_1117746 [Melampsora americana]|nr:hypothetical protein DFH28DRAFT_1117746 [Melampsora americana]
MTEGEIRFFAELEDILSLDSNSSLEELDNTFNNAIQAVAAALDTDLEDQHSLDQALFRVSHSDIFESHSQRMTSILLGLLKNSSPDATPSTVLVVCNLLLQYGLENHSFFRTLRNFSSPTINKTPQSSNLNPSTNVVHTLLAITKRMAFIPQTIADPNFVIQHFGRNNSTQIETHEEVSNPHSPNEKLAERRLGPVLAGLLYELCRVQKLDEDVLEAFNEDLIGNLFELVELTRDQEDETFNYNLIKLIIALNEQFMVLSIHKSSDPSPTSREGKPDSGPAHSSMTAGSRHRHGRKSGTHDPDTNIVIRTMKQRLDESKTFGENLIFILNRASHATPEGLCVSLLILKILYLLFTTLGTHEYFYTNDLCVLVDVFIRELSDLPDECDSLRHTYLRVLHPLLTSTQLRTFHYKRREIRHVLLSHIKYEHLREVNLTTKRLVERNLRADWCLELEKANDPGTEMSSLSRPHQVFRSASNETLASQASGSVGSVVEVTSSLTGSTSIHTDSNSVKAKTFAEEKSPSKFQKSPSRGSIPCIVTAQVGSRIAIGSSTWVSVESDPRYSVSVPISSSLARSCLSERKESYESTGSRSVDVDDCADDHLTIPSPIALELQPSGNSSLSLACTRSQSLDHPSRPTSASSMTSNPRRPAPKPPSYRRNAKESSGSVNSASSLPISSTAIRRTKSNADSPTLEEHDPSWGTVINEASEKTTSRRLPPSPPSHNHNPNQSSAVRRRKAPEPPTHPSSHRHIIDPSSFPNPPDSLHSTTATTRTLRGSKSNANLSRDTGRKLYQQHHHRVSSLSYNNTRGGDDYDPFEDRTEVAV